MLVPGGKEGGMPPVRLLLPMVGILPKGGGYLCTRGRAMLRVHGKQLGFSVTGATLLILVILPPNLSEEIRAQKVQVAGATVFAVGNGCTHLVAWVLVAAFSVSVAAVGSVSPAVFFMLKEAGAGTTFLALGLGSNAHGGSLGPGALIGVVTFVAMCAILRN